ncbi:MAG: DUF1684 domain-containing protein [Bacteroidia bacterium]|nr:DUF1684 domain-containing protein [Bacteroidia bacterium]NNF30316.1 DUF1684 domain-containing protein [Flavobacteriaceae bacterium]MBT8276392.1 DUF1684 domain-containing protein [Bacteroidia bacterium]NNJ80991.1 DUF1684 domain-containing protein [Flavobacteriaceae bacterium]NNK53539.1 DUF1684 domain-containing protein [Flavobacteriaceae bacterium]
MRIITLIIALLFLLPAGAQSKRKLMREIVAFHESENARFRDPATSPLKLDRIASFKALEVYPINLKYSVKAKLVRTPDEEPFLLRTNTERLAEYVKYGEAYFEIDGKELMLNLYRDPSGNESESNILFVPFTDLTSGDGSYGGGRYLEFKIPEKENFILDFNKAFNPYCVYSDRYSCPIPPRENDLFVRIEAGVKDYNKY